MDGANAPAQAAMLSPLPTNGSMDDYCVFIETAAQAILRSADDFKALGQQAYMNAYSAVTTFTVGIKPVKSRSRSMLNAGSEIMQLLKGMFKTHLDQAFASRPENDPLALVDFYAREWVRFRKSAELLSRVFHYHNRHWMLREHDEGKIAIESVCDFAMCSWRLNVVEPLHREIAAGCAQLVADESADLSSVAAVRDSYVAMRFASATAREAENAVYQKYLGQPMVAAFSAKQSKRAEADNNDTAGDAEEPEQGASAAQRLQTALLPHTVAEILQLQGTTATSEP